MIIYDTTLRDGTQGEGVSLSIDDKLKIVARLDRMGIQYIEGGWPGSNPKDAAFFEKVSGLKLRQAKVTAFGSTRKALTSVEDDVNLNAIVGSGVKVAAIFGKSWDFHVTHALRTTLEENLEMIRDSVSYLKANGLEVIYDAEHFFDAYKNNSEYAIATLVAAQEAGASTIVLCDTNGGALPSDIRSIVTAVKSKISIPLGIHAHNDGELAVANTLEAVSLGVRHVQGTMNGYGERAGNANLCSVLPNLQLKMGYRCVTDDQLAMLTETSRYISEIANIAPDNTAPFVGSSAFAHKAGIHVSALVRHPETYEHTHPEYVGNRRRVLVSELSGAASIVYKAKEYDVDLDKGSQTTRRLLEMVKDLENQGYHFEGAEGSFELMFRRSLGLSERFFELEGFRLIIDKKEGDGQLAEASVKLKVGEKRVHTVAEGDGPVNALDSALRKALEEFYPAIKNIHLSDFKVRVLDEKVGTAANVRVLVESRDGRRSWGTVGVSSNIIEASWRALVESIEYGIMVSAHDAEDELIEL